MGNNDAKFWPGPPGIHPPLWSFWQKSLYATPTLRLASPYFPLFIGKGNNIYWCPNFLNARTDPFSNIPFINESLGPGTNRKLYFYQPLECFPSIKSKSILLWSFWWHRKKCKQNLKSPIITVNILISIFYPPHSYHYNFFLQNWNCIMNIVL